MNSYMGDDLPKGSFDGLVIDKILVDAFRPKFGYEKDLVVFSFFVKQRDAANKLMSYIVQKNLDLLDVEVSPNPKSDPNKDLIYILFIEMNRNKDMFATMDKLLLHIDYLVSIKQWYFRASAYKKYMGWNRDNFVKVVPQTPDEYSNKGPVSGGHDEIDNIPQKSKDVDINHSHLEEVIERQVAKFNQSYIKSLKEQIKTINENKLQLSRHIEDLKIDREHLYKQLELSHDREKIALIREQQDFKRIKSLKNQLALLAAPGSREMEIVIPEKTAYDIDVKPVIGVVATETEVKDDEKIYAEIHDEYKEASEGDQHPDEAPALNESSDWDVAFDLHDEINLGESSGFVKEMEREFTDVDESIEKPAEQPEHEAFINAEKEKIDKTDNEKANWVAKPSMSAEDEEVHEPETPVKLQDLKYIESDDSAAAARLDDVIAQSLLEESTAKVDDESNLADDPVPKYVVLGQEALKKKDFDKAIEYFLKVVDILPTAGTIILNLADLYFLKKEYEAARKYAIQALELGEESATLVLENINTVLAPDAGLPSIEKSVEKIAGDVIAREEGYKDEAEEVEDTIFIEQAALNEAFDSTDNITPSSVEDAVSKDDAKKIDHNKNVARKFMALGVKAAGLKDYHKAIEHFSKAVEILPDSAAGFCNLAVLNYRLKEYETANMYAQKAIVLGSSSAIRILEKIKQVMGADLKSPAKFEPAAEIEKIKSSQVAKKDEGETFFIESAAATLDEFMKIEKQNQSDLAVDSSLREKDAVVNDSFRLGLEALEKKQFHKAIRLFNKVVELLPNGIPSYIHLTKIHYSLGEYPQARKHAEKALALGDYTLKPILEKIDAKLSKESTHPSTGSMKLKEQDTPAEVIEGAQEEPYVLETHADVKPDKNYKAALKHAERAFEPGEHSAHSILNKIEGSLEVKRKPDSIK
jgi:tetratricopeptide (TPR) repeat protein